MYHFDRLLWKCDQRRIKKRNWSTSCLFVYLTIKPVVSSFWLPCSGHRQAEEYRLRVLCVWVLRLYVEWYVHRGHESLWRPSRVWEEGAYRLLRVRWHNPYLKVTPFIVRSRSYSMGLTLWPTDTNTTTNWVYTRSIRALEVLQIDIDTSECDDRKGQT
jgi:hypothetical protein